MPVSVMKKFGADVSWAALRLSETLISARGVGCAVWLGRTIGRLFWHLRARRDLSMRNAAVVLTGRPVSEYRRAVLAGYMQSGTYWPEIVTYVHSGLHCARRNIRVEGREHLDAALARGKGVVAPSIHIGSFTLMGFWMAQAGYDFRYVIRVPHNERFFERLSYLSRLSGVGLIWDRPRKACVRTSHQVLAGGGIVCSLLDQPTMGQRGVEVEFFDHPFHAFGGTVSIALKTGAALVPMYLTSESGVRHKLVIEPEIETARTGDKAADVKAVLQHLMRRFEEWIRRYPGHWYWPSRKWRDV